MRFGYRATGPFVGLKKKGDPSQLRPGEARVANNVVLDDGRLGVREGWTEQVDFGDNEVLGIYDYLQNDGTVLQVASSGGALYKLSSWTSTELASSGFSTTKLLSAAVVSNRLYMGDGTAFKVTDGTNVYDAAIPRPTGTLTPAPASGSGSLSGTYDYKYSYYSSTWGQESPASDASAALEVDAKDIELTGWDVGTPDARVDKVRIYRRRTDTNEAVWRLDQEVAIPAGSGTVVTDAKVDNDISILFLAPESEDPPSGFAPTMMAWQAGVLFMVDPDFPTRIYYSMPGRDWVVDRFFELSGGSGDTEKITGLAAFQSIVVVFKENSIWILSGNSSTTLQARRTNSQVGCRSHHSIVPTDNLILFLSEEGLFGFDGSASTELSRPVQDDLLSRNYSRDEYCVGVHDYERNAVIWTYSSSGSTSNDSILVHFYRNSQVVEAPSWVNWSYSSGLSFPALVTDATSRKRSLALGFADGKVGLYGGNTDNTAAISWSWETGKVDMGVPERRKIWGKLAVENTAQSSHLLYKVSYKIDTDSVANLLGWQDARDPIFRRQVRRRSRDITLVFEGSAIEGQNEIIGWTLEAGEVGKAR